MKKKGILLIIFGSILIILQLLSLAGNALSGVKLQLSTDTFELFIFDLLYLLGYFLIGILGVILLAVGVVRYKNRITKTPSATTSAAPHSDAAAQETVYLMEAANGMLVHVPESRLETWQAAQDAQRTGSNPDHTPERQALVDRIVEDFYRTPKPTASKPKRVNPLIVVICLLALLLALSVIYIVSLHQQVNPEINTTTDPSVSKPSEPIIVGDPVNINTATAEQLQKLPGIDAIFAQRIIDYRYLHGPFNKISDICSVEGIELSIFNQISNLVSVGNSNINQHIDIFVTALRKGYVTGYESAFFDCTDGEDGYTSSEGAFLLCLLGFEDNDSKYKYIIQYRKNAHSLEFLVPENTDYLTETNGYQQGYSIGYIDGLLDWGSISEHDPATSYLSLLKTQFREKAYYNSTGILYNSLYKWLITYRNSIK